MVRIVGFVVNWTDAAGLNHRREFSRHELRHAIEFERTKIKELYAAGNHRPVYLAAVVEVA